METVDYEGPELRYGSEKGFVLVYEENGSVAREMGVDIEYVESRDRYRLVQKIDHGDRECMEMWNGLMRYSSVRETMYRFCWERRRRRQARSNFLMFSLEGSDMDEYTGTDSGLNPEGYEVATSEDMEWFRRLDAGSTKHGIFSVSAGSDIAPNEVGVKTLEPMLDKDISDRVNAEKPDQGASGMIGPIEKVYPDFTDDTLMYIDRSETGGRLGISERSDGQVMFAWEGSKADESLDEVSASAVSMEEDIETDEEASGDVNEFLEIGDERYRKRDMFGETETFKALVDSIETVDAIAEGYMHTVYNIYQSEEAYVND